NPTTSTSNGSGIAATTWTLGTAAGTQTVQATGPGSPVTFSASATPGAATQLTISTQPSATAQSGVAFTPQPVLQLRDANGNGVSQAGTTVTATIATGPTGATLTDAAATTTGSGAATFSGLAISGSLGSYTLRFESGTLTAPTSGTITLSAGAAATIAANSLTSQSATAGTAVSTPPSVIVKDASGNPVAQVAVTFAVAPGNGTIAGASQTTNASGVATVGSWTLSVTAGDNTLTATSGSLSGSPVTFTATGTAGAAATIVANSARSEARRVGEEGRPPWVTEKDAKGE